MREGLSPTDQEVLMHARLTVLENVDLDLNDRLTAFMEVSTETRSATSRATADR